MQRKYTFTTRLTLTLFFLFVSTALFLRMSDQKVMQEVMKYNNQGISQQQTFFLAFYVLFNSSETSSWFPAGITLIASVSL